jgi:hypothetical protein
MLMTGNDFITAAEVAKAMAERNMNIKRQRAMGSTLAGTDKIGFAVSLAELQRGRIRSVTGTRDIIFLQQDGIPLNCLRHDILSCIGVLTVAEALSAGRSVCVAGLSAGTDAVVYPTSRAGSRTESAGKLIQAKSLAEIPYAETAPVGAVL